MWFLLLAATSLAASDGADAVLAEAWVVADSPLELAAVRSLGAEPAEGMRATRDGHLEHRVLVDEVALERLREQGHRLRVTRTDHRLGPPPAGYHSLDQGQDLIRTLADQAPRAGLVQLGTSTQGRALLALWLGQPPNDPRARSLWVVAAHHGDELSSVEVALDLATTLAQADGHDPELTRLLDQTTVWVAPWVNPDGVVLGQRYNANGVDINRNYGHMWSDDGARAGEAPFSEPETRAMRTLGLFEPASHSLSLHSGETNLGWVWNWTTTHTLEEELLRELAEVYEAQCTTEGFWITNGAAWYTTRGDANDWAYGTRGGMDYTLELTRDKTPRASEIPDFIADHRQAILAFVELEPNLQGRVVDASTHRPVPATGWLYRDGASIPFTADPVGGRYARHVEAEPARLTFTSPGYKPEIFDWTPHAGGPGEEIALVRVSDQTGRPVPSRLAHSGWVELPDAPESSQVGLQRTGMPPALVDVEDGRIYVNVDDLVPGPWSVVFEDGSAWPRSLFIADELPILSSAQGDEASITLQGAGFAQGTRAFGLWGPDRALAPLAVLAESDTEVTVDLSHVPWDETVDLLLLSNGGQQVILDVTGDPDVDTAAPQDTGLTDTGFRLVSGGCGCNSTGAVPLWLPLVLLALRRRTS